MAALWAADHQPARRGRRGPDARRRRRRASSPTSSSCSSTPRRLRRDGPRDGFLITEAVRGEGATLLERRRASASWTSWPRATRSRWRSRPSSTQRPPRGRPRHARGRRGPLPQHRRGAGRGRHRPGARARPGGSGRALHDGRRGGRPRRQVYAARALRRRRVRLHRPARRQPARLELARRVLRLRPPRRRSPAPADPEPPRRRRPRPSRPRRRCRRTRRAPRCGATPACSATPARLRELLEDPLPAGPADRGVRLAREESRGAHQRVDHPERDPALDRMHTLVGAGARAALRAMGVERRDTCPRALHGVDDAARLGVAVITARRPDGAPCGLAATSRRLLQRPPAVAARARSGTLALPRRPGDLRALRRPPPEERRAGRSPSASPTASSRTSSPASTGAGTARCRS